MKRTNDIPPLARRIGLVLAIGLMLAQTGCLVPPRGLPFPPPGLPRPPGLGFQTPTAAPAVIVADPNPDSYEFS